ncbi:MAG: acyl carrier protein [Telmatospirillum sp.]|nr:acyl carrier protein [Telmatospirillum sp.]
MAALTAIMDDIRDDLILGQLGLAAEGLSARDIAEDTPLLDGGLAIDSVAALDLLVAVEQKFGVRMPGFDKDFIRTTCATLGTLARFVESAVREKTAAP